ncbi:MAG: 3-phosphoglycerate dehydrogenase [Calditrichaceae bacterium]|nr:3-phosphoglycerate dehydrogenase [Calditrichaceae bacterium]
MAKVLIATEKPFAAAAVSQIKSVFDDAGYEVFLLEKYEDKADLLKAVADVDALIIRSDKVTPEVIETGKNLKIVVRAGAGYDNVDLAAASAKNVVVMNTPGQNSNAVAELAIGMMIYQARGQFNGKSGTEIKDKSLGILAYGNVGKIVAKLGMAFGMQVFAFDPFVSAADIQKDGVEVVNSIGDLFAKCNYVSLHIPANDQTKKSINYALMSKMPAAAAVVNTARKEVIDEDGLLKMYADRDDFVYISDVAPDCAAEIAEKFPGRFYFTPKKMGAQTAEANVNAGIAAAKQIVNFLEKGDKTFQVNK